MDFEILISTMFRTDLLFLDNIFSKTSVENYNVLIINQTDDDKFLNSSLDNIRVCNSLERGTSNSRNLAIENAKGNICLFADDDTIFEENFENIITSEFKKHQDMYLLSFESTSGEKKDFHLDYPKLSGIHTKNSLRKVHMITMAFNRQKLIESKVRFNQYFSLGGKFNGGTEYVFLRNAFSKGLKAFHIKKTIVHHIDDISSGKKMESDQKIHTSSARANHFNGVIYAYLWLCKYLFFLLRNGLIKSNQIAYKFRVGVKGINEYTELLNKGLISRQK